MRRGPLSDPSAGDGAEGPQASERHPGGRGQRPGATVLSMVYPAIPKLRVPPPAVPIKISTSRSVFVVFEKEETQMKTWKVALAAAIVLAVTAATPASVSAAEADRADQAALTGTWISEKGGLVLDFQPCDDSLCGTIVWLKKPYRKDGTLRRDIHNNDPALRDQPWCGMTVIRGLQEDEDGRWRGGTLYDPKSGITFSVDLRSREGRLDIRAYAALRALGKTERFYRSTDATKTGCSTAHLDRQSRAADPETGDDRALSPI